MTGAYKIVDLKSTYIANTRCETFMKVLVCQIQGADLLYDSFGVCIKYYPKDHVSNSQSRAQKRGWHIDDILVDETAVPASNLISHFDKFGPTAKPPESLDGGTTLGPPGGRGKVT